MRQVSALKVRVLDLGFGGVPAQALLAHVDKAAWARLRNAGPITVPKSSCSGPAGP